MLFRERQASSPITAHSWLAQAWMKERDPCLSHVHAHLLSPGRMENWHKKAACCFRAHQLGAPLHSFSDKKPDPKRSAAVPFCSASWYPTGSLMLETTYVFTLNKLLGGEGSDYIEHSFLRNEPRGPKRRGPSCKIVSKLFIGLCILPGGTSVPSTHRQNCILGRRNKIPKA